jgi:hypothetical protein
LWGNQDKVIERMVNEKPQMQQSELCVSWTDETTGKRRYTGNRAALKASQAYPKDFAHALMDSMMQWRASAGPDLENVAAVQDDDDWVAEFFKEPLGDFHEDSALPECIKYLLRGKHLKLPAGGLGHVSFVNGLVFGLLGGFASGWPRGLVH